MSFNEHKQETDKDIGARVRKHLESLRIETPIDGRLQDVPTHERIKAVRNHVSGILDLVGLDLKDDSIADTPKRVAVMYMTEIFRGLDYDNFPKCTVIENKMNHNELVAVCNIEVTSCCEHHLLPFIGKAHVGYIPKDKIIGLSKFNRIVDFFCKRPQVQERLTEQISAALSLILGTPDVAVVLSAEHMCVRMRGIRDSGSSTVTSKMQGKFFNNIALREEFMNLTRSYSCR